MLLYVSHLIIYFLDPIHLTCVDHVLIWHLPQPQEREALYGSAESSSASAAVYNGRESGADGKMRKSEEARRERENEGRRRSVSEERLSEERLSEEEPPPRYEDVVRGDGRGT